MGAGPAGQAFLGVGEEVAVAGLRMVGVVVPGVPVAVADGPTVGTAGTLGPAQHRLNTASKIYNLRLELT